MWGMKLGCAEGVSMDDGNGMILGMGNVIVCLLFKYWDAGRRGRSRGNGARVRLFQVFLRASSSRAAKCKLHNRPPLR